MRPRVLRTQEGALAGFFAPLPAEETGALAPRAQPLAPGAGLLRGFALPWESALAVAIAQAERSAPFRHLETPGGWRMSVATTNCGTLGWYSDRRGYRYEARDPQSGRPWPPLADSVLLLAAMAAAACGFPEFVPDACLINRYAPGAKMNLHQDKDERDFAAPIVSVSLGLPAVFVLGGGQRSDKTCRIPLRHGDVVVWGGPARLRFHGVLPVKAGQHDVFAGHRLNLTLRRAG